MKAFWVVASAFCGAAAVFFVVREDYDKMFIAAAVGTVAWFLSYRVRLRETLRNMDETGREEEDDEEG